jgi:hypothetical protein
MSKFGTLVLYDVENLKTPLNTKRGDYILSRVDLLEVDESIRRVFDDVHYNNFAFVRSYHEKDRRWSKNDKFFNFLKSSGFTVVEKRTKKAKNVITTDGKKFVYSYEECDMDANIVHHILTLGRDYARVILLSGDDDMHESLKYIQEQCGTEVVVIAHKENMSNVMKEFKHMYLHELIERGADNKIKGKSDERS